MMQWLLTVWLGEGHREIRLPFDNEERARAAFDGLAPNPDSEGIVEISGSDGIVFGCDPRDILARLIEPRYA